MPKKKTTSLFEDSLEELEQLVQAAGQMAQQEAEQQGVEIEQ